MAGEFLGGRPVFGRAVPAEVEFDGNPKAVFVRLVSALYVDYRESGRASLRFLYERSPARSELEAYMAAVGSLRTLFQHGVGTDSADDVRVREAADGWFEAACDVPSPTRDTEWVAATESLAQQACRFYELLEETLVELVRDDQQKLVAQQWLVALRRVHQPEDFDSVISMAAADMGRHQLNVRRFRNTHKARWVADLENLPGDYDFALEARRSIERDLLVGRGGLLPITGQDLIQSLGLVPGRDVERMLKRGLLLHLERRRTRTELLSLLQQEIAGPSSWSNER